MQHLWHSFGLKGAQATDGAYSFTTTRIYLIVEAAEYSKGRKLKDDAVQIMGLTGTCSLPVRVYESLAARDYSQEHGTETTCAVFNSFVNKVEAGDAVFDKATETRW